MTPGLHGWQLEGASAELYEQLLVPTVTLPWARDLVARLELLPGQRVLDVACGTGIVARLAAPAVGDGGRVAAVDVNRQMLAVGQSLSPPAGAPIEWREGSADALPFGDAEFDVILCQLGLQFFPDRQGALREMRRVLRPTGRVGVSVFAAIDRNPAARALADAVDRHLGAGASGAKRSEHALADPDELRALFDAAGFAGVEIDAVSQMIRFASVAEWVEVQFTATPLAALTAGHDAAERSRIIEAVGADVGDAMSGFTSDGVFAFPQELQLALVR